MNLKRVKEYSKRLQGDCCNDPRFDTIVETMRKDYENLDPRLPFEDFEKERNKISKEYYKEIESLQDELKAEREGLLQEFTSELASALKVDQKKLEKMFEHLYETYERNLEQTYRTIKHLKSLLK